jgi:hypothetical protein
LVIATLYTFGLKRGVGLDTISEFFVRLHLAVVYLQSAANSLPPKTG